MHETMHRDAATTQSAWGEPSGMGAAATQEAGAAAAHFDSVQLLL